jgi:glycosyltransferase involved in cell wall biosynthesis
VSVVVIAFNMARELPRTLRSLSPSYQRGIEVDDYEVIVVDNGSSEPVSDAAVAEFEGHLRVERVDPAPPSPACAANLGLRLADGELIGLLIDGARLASPGLLATALRSRRIAPRPIIATLAWHLGSHPHMRASEVGYDQQEEDRLLREANWEADGYRLFDFSTFAGSSRRGWFGPLGESNALFMSRDMWWELGGLDERFVSPGGGYVNHDLFRRACTLDDAELIVLLGEGTFHQIHGGISTSRRFLRDAWNAEYEALRGAPFTPSDRPATLFGTVPTATLRHLDYSVQHAMRAQERNPPTATDDGPAPER